MLEGLTLDTWWDWKDTLGPLKERPGFQGVWGMYRRAIIEDEG